MPKNPPGDRLAVAAAVALTHLGAAYTGARWHAASCTPSVPTRWPPPPPPRACSAPTGPTWPPAWTPSSTPPPARAQPPAERIRSNGWTYRFSPISCAFRQEENASPRGPEDQRTARVSSGPLVLRVRPICLLTAQSRIRRYEILLCQSSGMHRRSSERGRIQRPASRQKPCATTRGLPQC